MPSVTFLIGIPCSGKSNYRKKYFSNALPISRDDIREQIVCDFLQRGVDFQYSDFFKRPEKGETSHPQLGDVINGAYEHVTTALKLSDEQYNIQLGKALGAVLNGVDVVVDMLNLTPKAREDIINLLDVDDVKVTFEAVVFEFEKNMGKIEKLNEIRSNNGKSIPFSVIRTFAETLELPCPVREPFRKVTHVDGLEGVTV